RSSDLAPPAAAGPPIDLMTPRAPAGGVGPGTAGGAPGPSATGGQGRGMAGDGRAALGDGARENPGDDYLDRLRRHLARFKSYPEVAKQRREEGSVAVSFTILRDGTLTAARIERSSGSESLDRAALDLLRTASPAPPLPATYAGEAAAVTLPISYSLSLLRRLF
ncbi:MAG: energy transducer TonB, partial [Alphaproteobacteria bacterium]